MIRKIRYEDAIADDRYKAVRSMFRDCTIAGCIYSALYYVQRPGMEGEIAVCRKCAEELIGAYKWKFVRTMTKEERAGVKRSH